MRTCTLFAPAASVGLFESHYYPYLLTQTGAFGLDRMQVLNLNDRLERDDTVGQVYRKSLLYLVSRAFEEQTPEAILGMQTYMDELLRKPKMEAVRDRFAGHYADGRPNAARPRRTIPVYSSEGATNSSSVRCRVT